MSERVIVDVDNHVATVMLNRAAKKNAVDVEMFEAMAAAAANVGNDRSIRAVVLCGEGDDFCAGIDVSLFGGGGNSLAGLLEARSASGANFFQEAAMAWRELPVPVIAALRGAVFGAGLQIALGADLRYAAADVRMSIMEIKWGLIPDMAITATLDGVIPRDKALELSLTGRIVSADEALELGLVTGINDEPLANATALAHEIAGYSPDAIRAIKRLLHEAWSGDIEQSLKLEATLQASVMRGRNQAEAVAANLEKRTPRFTDPAD